MAISRKQYPGSAVPLATFLAISRKQASYDNWSPYVIFSSVKQASYDNVSLRVFSSDEILAEVAIGLLSRQETGVWNLDI